MSAQCTQSTHHPCALEHVAATAHLSVRMATKGSVTSASGLGAAVVGDGVYGKADGLGMMLHAQRLIVPRPGKPDVLAEAPLPERFAKAGFADEAAAVPAAVAADVVTPASTDD